MTTTHKAMYDLCRNYARHQARRYRDFMDLDAIDGAAGLALAEAMSKFNPKASALSSYAYQWVRGTVSRIVHRKLLRDKSVSQFLADDKHHTPPIGPPPMADVVSLRRQLAKLPPVTRSTVWMRHGLGHSVVEIARTQARSRASVHRDLRVGMKRLKHVMSDTGGLVATKRL